MVNPRRSKQAGLKDQKVKTKILHLSRNSTKGTEVLYLWKEQPRAKCRRSWASPCQVRNRCHCPCLVAFASCSPDSLEASVASQKNPPSLLSCWQGEAKSGFRGEFQRFRVENGSEIRSGRRGFCGCWELFLNETRGIPSIPSLSSCRNPKISGLGLILGGIWEY